MTTERRDLDRLWCHRHKRTAWVCRRLAIDWLGEDRFPSCEWRERDRSENQQLTEVSR